MRTVITLFRTFGTLYKRSQPLHILYLAIADDMFTGGSRSEPKNDPCVYIFTHYTWAECLLSRYFFPEAGT
jgi:hypothetical protein